MTDPQICQFKVWAFLRRNTALLSHDEYRAGHVGFHCSNTRRLKRIRGYTVNIHDENTEFGRELAATDVVSVTNEPPQFLELWDGFPAVHFDNRQEWTEAGSLEPTRATEKGLVVDPDFTLSDGPYLFDRLSPSASQFRSYHIRVHEHVLRPVLRGESRPFKLVQFFRASSKLESDEFAEHLLREYATQCSTLDGLNGLVVNLRDADIDSAVSGYYPDDHWCFTPEGRAFRERFFGLWDGAIELWFDSAAEFVEARRRSPLLPQLQRFEEHFFEALWYVAVDENLIVMPNRHPAPEFYYR